MVKICAIYLVTKANFSLTRIGREQKGKREHDRRERQSEGVVRCFLVVGVGGGCWGWVVLRRSSERIQGKKGRERDKEGAGGKDNSVKGGKSTRTDEKGETRERTRRVTQNEEEKRARGSRRGARVASRGARRGEAAGGQEKAIDAHPPNPPSRPSRNPRSSGGGRHGGACKSAWRRDALPTLPRSYVCATYTGPGVWWWPMHTLIP